MEPTVLITGGTGFIGSHTAVQLLESGHQVVIVDNLSNSEAWVIDRIGEITGKTVFFVEADCCNRTAMEEVFRAYRFDAAIHFAALKAVGESVGQPLAYYRNNLDSLIVLLETMQKHAVGSLVFSSSCTVYGQPEQLPVIESTPRKEAESPYGNTKRISEDIISDTVKASNGQLKAVNLRYFNPIGAHPSGWIGELPRGIPSNLVPYITQTAAGLRDKLFIFGDDYHTPDGTAIRDYIDVNDLASAHVKAVNRLLKGQNKADNEFFNIGTGKGLSVLEIVTAFKKTTGKEFPVETVGRRAGDIQQIWADTSLANRELNWKAQTPLSETLSNAWKWQQQLCKKK